MLQNELNNGFSDVCKECWGGHGLQRRIPDVFGDLRVVLGERWMKGNIFPVVTQ